MTEESARASLNLAFETRTRETQAGDLRSHLDPSFSSQVLHVCKANPHLALEYYNFYGVDTAKSLMTPLEIFILCHVPLAIIKEFCHLFPKAITIESQRWEGGLPLHLVCQRFETHNRELLQCLTLKYPEAAAKTDDEGNLPLHILLQRVHENNGDLNEEKVKAVENLVKTFPQSITMTGSDKVITPTSFVFSSPFFPSSVRDCFAKYMQELDVVSLTLSEVVLGSQGASQIMQSLTKSSKLRKVNLEISWCYLRDNEEFHSAVLTTLPELMTATSLIFSFSDSPRDFERWTSDLAEPVADLLYSGSLVELILKDKIKIEPEPIMQAIVNHPDSSLETLDIRCFGSATDMTQLIANAIGANSNLRSLAISNVTITNQLPIFRALARNTRLKSLALPNLISSIPESDDSNEYGKLSNVLRKHNTSLHQLRCYQATFVEMQGNENQTMLYYARLNRFGRNQTRLESFDCSDLVKLLMSLNYRNDTMLGICFGLLMECPVTWTTHLRS